MKKIFLITAILVTSNIFSQTFTTNTTPVGMEHNMLFNATTRFQVTQTGSAGLDLIRLFDGKFSPSYTNVAPTTVNPTVILIENLPSIHTQTGAWVGWSTRYWPALRFKIEGENIFNSWITIADYSTQDYSGASFVQKLPKDSFTKLRFTFYTASGVDGRLGVSELFFIHPEAVRPYEGLLAVNDSSTWNNNGLDINYSTGNVSIGTSTSGAKLSIVGPSTSYPNNQALSIKAAGESPIFRDHVVIDSDATNGYGIAFAGQGHHRAGIYAKNTGGTSNSKGELTLWTRSNGAILMNGGNVGIGTPTPDAKLSVNGKIHAKEVKVDLTGWPDYVFTNNYKLPTLASVEKHIKEKGHLQNIPSAKEVSKNGIELGEMNKKLLQKIEELTLYTIQQDKNSKKLLSKIEKLESRMQRLEKE
jgi:hypothetical protein